MKHNLQCLIFFSNLKLSRKEEALKDLISKIDITVVIPIEVMMSLKWLVFFVVADDHSRVVLTGKREIPGSDYINANYVDVRVFFTILRSIDTFNSKLEFIFVLIYRMLRIF